MVGLIKQHRKHDGIILSHESVMQTHTQKKALKRLVSDSAQMCSTKKLGFLSVGGSISASLYLRPESVWAFA